MKQNLRKILVVDDHPLTRKGLCEAINTEKDLCICGEAESCRDALRLIREQRPDLLILDLNLNDGNGWTLLDQLKAEDILPPTLILSVCDENLYAQRLLRAGARGYLMKDEPIAKLLAAIRKALAGHIAVSDTLASALIQNAAGSGNAATVSVQDTMEQLSDRELQVYEMLSQGLRNKAIAERLGISQKTISTYKARLMEKLGVRTTPELIERTRNTRWTRNSTL